MTSEYIRKIKNATKISATIDISRAFSKYIKAQKNPQPDGFLGHKKAKKNTKRQMIKKSSLPHDKASVSVVIPTFNAGDRFDELLKKLTNQKNVQVEIIIVDSGSIDNTINIAKKYKAKILQIKQKEFSHSAARNLGAKNATGEYLLFMVQDAMPEDDLWITRLLRPFCQSDVVAVSCVQEPNPDCDLFGKSSIFFHIKSLGLLSRDRIGSIESVKTKSDLRPNAQLDDVSCLIKKKIFDQFKYRGEYAEDLDLGIRLIKSNYKLAFLGTVHVIHSHNRPSYYYFKRAIVDVKTLNNLLDITPQQNASEQEVLNYAIHMYCFTKGLIKEIQKTNFQSLNQFENMIDWIFYKNSKILQYKSRQGINKIINSKCAFEDENLKKIVLQMFDQARKIKMKDKIFMEQQKEIIWMALDYCRYNQYKICNNLKNEICDAMMKRAGQMIGVTVGEYRTLHDDTNDVIVKLANEQGRGI